jgi:LacI family transcriptional regulator
VIRGDFTEASGYAAGRAIAAEDRPPAAVFAANDGMAIGCLAAFTEVGLAVPARIAVTGFDDIPLAAFVRPALTTMRVRITELGRGAVDRLAEAIAAPGAVRGSTTLFRPDLIVRDSCGAVVTRTPPLSPQPADRGHDGTDHHHRIESRQRSDHPRRTPRKKRRR